VESFCSSLGLELVDEEKRRKVHNKRREERSITLEEEDLVLRL
jgi:hypothetical protein